MAIVLGDDGREVWTPWPGRQQRALSIDIFEILAGGMRGGGKTELAIVWTGIPACGPMAHPRYRGLVIRENHKDLLQWIDRSHRFYAPYGGTFLSSSSRWVFPNGAQIQMGHMADKSAFRHFQGQEFHRVNWEELTQCPSEDLYVKTICSLRSTIPSLPVSVFCTANPGGPGHSWVKKRFVTPGIPEVPFWDPGLKKWRVYLPIGLEDNPALMQDSEYVDLLNGIPDEHLRRAWRHGDWDILEGQYFPEWSRDRHVCTPFEIPPHWETHVGIDWGYKPDPCAVLYFAMSPQGHVYLWKEEYYNETIPSKIAQKIMNTGKTPTTVIAGGDMWAERNSPDSTAAQMMAEGMWMLKKAKLSRQARLDGWMRVHEYLQRRSHGRRLLQVFSNCTKIIAYLPEMIHDPDHPADALKNSEIDHGPDALRYFLSSKPLAPIQAKPEKQYAHDRDRRAAEYLKRLAEKEAIKKRRDNSRGW